MPNVLFKSSKGGKEIEMVAENHEAAVKCACALIVLKGGEILWTDSEGTFRAKRVHGGRAQFVLAVFDVDAFKQINDTHGHPMGDQVLVALAEKLKVAFRDDDIVARFGGDEFAVLAAGLTLRQAESRFKSVLAMLPGVSPMPDHQPPLTMSCGVAECSAGDTKDSLLRRADQALYDAKKLGKNRVATKATQFISDLKRR